MQTPRDDIALLLQAALDGELDAVGMMEIEAKLAADPALAAEYARLSALRAVIRARVPREAAPESLRARVLSMARTGHPAGAPAPLGARVLSMTQSAGRALTAALRRSELLDSPYRLITASLMLGIALGTGVSGLVRSPPANEVEQAIVAGYVRGRLSGQPVDIATSDRHTVKPWLAGRIASPTTVVDLAKDGFPLVGGRIDVIGMTPVPTLIYQRREHQIALTEMRASDDDASSAPRRETRDGYSLLSWSHQGRRYAAVSDMPPSELDAFHEAFSRAAAAEHEEAPKP
jgi:anti-sigma factor RsiW